ncbi:uncharacterized protein LOC121729585 [Aricia agestis]|uniref:uncharacterized protein LOC121729585 n=1 Tax=Aricia agestis TaxID=91739 RepID=UPI001C201BF6|nr:uncharacterized protein LOC121729585 [Aricia agestis]
MYLRKSTTLKYLIVAPIAAVLYCEWFVYIIQPVFWNNLECRAADTSCTKILFIADPQIQGDEGAPSPLNHLFNWDCDRYLRSTFSVVLKHFQPDVLVFLGDLMDEGSISSMIQFHNYVKRLSNIFDVYYPIVQIWLPGDNDIGGENEPIRKDKVIEFNKVFEQPSVISYRNISFYKVNAVTYSVPQMPDVEDLNLRMALSHYPILNKGGYGKQVHNAIHPDVYFCAHEHQSKYMRLNRNFERKETHLLQYVDSPLEIGFDNDFLYEIYVPTCSYRMGTDKIGFGAAIVENNNQQLKYTVFWSPKRFPYLYLYIFIVLVIIIYNVFFCIIKTCTRYKRFVKSDDVLPLLQRI